MDEDEQMAEQLNRMIEELRRYARGMLRRSDPALTIQATDLVNMAYLKLQSVGKVDLSDPKAVFGLYITTMKTQLLDYLKARKSQKRGGGAARAHVECLDQMERAGVTPEQLLEGLDELAAIGKKRQADAVFGRIVSGLTNAELAEQLGVSIKTIEEDLRTARDWLKERQLRIRESAG